MTNPLPATTQPARPRTSLGTILTRIVFSLLVMALMFSLLGNMFQMARMSAYFSPGGSIQEEYHSRSKAFDADKVAVIRVTGVIMSGEGYVRRQIDRVMEDKDVKAIVLRVDSPGGTVTGSDYIYHHLTKLVEERDIPLVVSMGSMATSGGYYVSMAVGDEKKSIFAEPTSTTGSIGVIIPHYNISGLMEKYDVEDDSIVSHEQKAMLRMSHKMSDTDRGLLQDYVNNAFGQFKEKVKAGRPKFRNDDAALNEVATGRMFSAVEAKEVGLVDELGFIEEAIDRAAELAQLDKDKIRVVKYQKEVSMMDLFMGAKAQGSSNMGVEMVRALEASTPRAYYISTWLPPVVSSSMPQE